MLNPGGARGSRAHANQMPQGNMIGGMSFNMGHGHHNLHGGMSGAMGNIMATTQADEQYNYSIPSEQIYSASNLPQFNKNS